MEFKFDISEYRKNLDEYMALDHIDFMPTETKEEVIEKLKDISLKKKAIADKQNAFIAEYIEPFETGKEKVNDEIACKLEELIESLSYGKEQQDCKDMPIVLRVCRVLYHYYHNQGNIEKTIHTIKVGTDYEFIIAQHRSDQGLLDFPKLCDEYIPIIKSLSTEVQVELLDSFSKCLIAYNPEAYDTVLKEFPDVLNKFYKCIEYIDNKDKTEWICFNMIFHFANIFDDICRQNNLKLYQNKPPKYIFDIDKIRSLLENPLKNAEIKNYDNPIIDLQIKNICYKTYFHFGLLNIESFFEKLDELYNYGKENNLGVLNDLIIGYTYLEFLHYCCPYTKEKKYQLAKERISEVMPKVLSLKNKKQYIFSHYVLAFLCNTSYFLDFTEFYETVLDFTVYADKALYVHTVMVKEISHLILDRILKYKPEYINGVCGYDYAYICEHKQEMLDIIDKCAMCHDIGKHFMIDTVSNSSRRLTDDEFAIIKAHPKNFEIVYDYKETDTVIEKCIHDCALLHHRWHNGEGGYPNLPHNENRPFVDIITIADCLDAATDSIGRPYGAGKKLGDLIKEFIEMSDSRYSREIAGLLCESEIKDGLNHIITKRREEVNYKIYAFNTMS